tara:strand:- start:155 stop:523 length:369 start_codon:yes stop_codon:yes gene_type:complete
MIIFVKGRNQSGKTTFAESLKEIVEDNAWDHLDCEVWDNTSWDLITERRNRLITWPSHKILVISLHPAFYCSSDDFSNKFRINNNDLFEKDKHWAKHAYGKHLDVLVENLRSIGKKIFVVRM